MSENSVVIINLKDLSKINDAYCALNLSGVCVDYDDEIQMKFGKRIIIGQVLHKYPAYRDLKNPDRDCLVLMMRKAYPKICLVEETRVFRFMILGSELVSKLLQVQLNSFLAFMNFKMFGTFNTSEPSFSIGNSCGVVWIFPNLNHITSKVRNCTEYIEKIFGKQHDGHNEEMRGSSSRNHLRKGRPDAQRKFTQGTCIHDGYTSTPVTKKKNNSNILVEGFNEPKTTSSFIKESLEARREQKSNSTKFETGSQRDSLLVGKNYNTCLNTYLQKKNFASSDHQTLHRKDTCACSQIAVSCRKQCCNAINCCNTNYMTNMLEICSSSSKTSFNDQKVCLKYNVCECKRRNDAPLCQISERCLSPDHVKTSVRTYINEKSNSLAPVSDQHFGIRNCKCHEQKIGSVINASSVVEAHDRVQNWLDNIQVLPRTHSTLPLKDLSKKGRSYFNHNFGSQRQKTEKVNNYVESESNITVKRKTNSLENNYFSKSNNRNKRKLFFADPNVSLIKVQADKTGIILSKEDSHKFEDNHISDNVVSDIRNFPEIYGKIDGKEIKKEMSEEYISREKNHSVCNLESHETNGEINDASKTVYSNKKSNNSKAEESTLIENASLDMNKCDENNILDLNKSGDNNCDSCNLTSSTIPVSNEGVNINSQQTQTESSQPYYDAQENSELKNSSLGTELGDISKSLSEQSVTSLKKLFSYEDKEAREVTLAKLRKLKQEVQIKSVLVDILPELSHLRPLAIVKGVCRSGCKKYFAVEELPSFRDVTLTKCKYCRQTLHRICPECTKDGDKFLCLLYSFGLHVLYGTNVIRIAVYGRDAVRFLGCPLETYLSWSSVSSNIIMKFNKIRVWVPPEDWSEVTMLQLNLMTNKHYDGTIMPKVVNTYFGDALYRKGSFISENDL